MMVRKTGTKEVIMKKELIKNKKCVRALYKGDKNRTLLGYFNSKKDAQNFFELNIGKLPNRTRNHFCFNGETYHIMYEYVN